MMPRAESNGERYTRLVAGALFPLQERLKGHSTVAVRKALELSQWWSPERLRELQLARLRALLDHAGRHVPHYHETFSRIGFDPAGVASVEDLRQLPLLTKRDIRADPDRFKSAQSARLVRSNTGGSSGEPLVFYLGDERVSHDVAAKWRATRWWDVDIGDREIVVWGSPIELAAQDRARQLRDHVMRTRLLPAFEMSDAKLDDFVATIRAFRPKMLFGYPSALAHIARHAMARGVRMDDLGIKVAFVTSERLYDDQRATIEGTFGCRAANGYGGRDAGFIAHECASGGMHITAEDVIVETVDPQGRPMPAGEGGEIVVTHLASRDFPFIRYRTGDIGSLQTQTCACGRGLPLLGEIHGRATDFVVSSDGTVMHGLALIYVMRELPGIDAFRIVQESRVLTRVLVVPGDHFEEGTAEAIVSGFRRRLGSNVEIRIEPMSVLPAESSGKMRYVISRVSVPAGGAPEPAPTTRKGEIERESDVA
jgi:phenylacetate-CoA ligase